MHRVLTFFDIRAYVVLRRHAALEGGIHLNDMQRVVLPCDGEDALRRSADHGCGCGDGRAAQESRQSAHRGGGCGQCACARSEHEYVCGFGVEEGTVAALYIPLQVFDGLYDLSTALRRGTMFEALDKPLYGDGKGVDCRGRER